MTDLELFQAVNRKFNETKKKLQKSFFSKDKTYFNEMLNAFPNAKRNEDIYETINNIASRYARSLDY